MAKRGRDDAPSMPAEPLAVARSADGRPRFPAKSHAGPVFTDVPAAAARARTARAAQPRAAPARTRMGRARRALQNRAPRAAPAAAPETSMTFLDRARLRPPRRPGLRRRRPGAEHFHRHRRHRRRVLPAGRRHGRGAVEVRARHAGHRRSHRRLGRQPEADRQRQTLHRLHDGRCRARTPIAARTSSRATRSRCAR